MSWSVNAIGTKDKVRAKVEADFDNAAKSYAGQEEEKDVLAAKDRCLSSIDEMQTDEHANAIKVECSGSRSTWSMSMKVEVQRVRIDI